MYRYMDIEGSTNSWLWKTSRSPSAIFPHLSFRQNSETKIYIRWRGRARLMSLPKSHRNFVLVVFWKKMDAISPREETRWRDPQSRSQAAVFCIHSTAVIFHFAVIHRFALRHPRWRRGAFVTEPDFVILPTTKSVFREWHRECFSRVDRMK